MSIAPTASDVLVIVEVQNDFCAGGALATADGHKTVPVINALARHFENVVQTQDWHPRRHVSFASAHPGKAPFEVIAMPYGAQVLWPDHCVQGTKGAEFHPGLDVPHVQLIIRKGYNRNVDSYSAFCMVDGVTRTGLGAYLTERGFKRVFVAGIATDYCVGGLALDARKAGFETLVIEDACAAVSPDTAAKAWADMAAAGVKRIASAEIA